MHQLFGPPTVSFCESISNTLVSRPYAALSNLAYFLVAYLIYRKARGSKILINFSLVVLLVASLSFIYDIKSVYLTQIFDLTGMLILIDFLLYQDLSKLYKKSEKKILTYLFLFTLIGLSIIILFKGVAGNIVFGSFVLADVYVQDLLYRKRLNHDYKYWIWAFLIFAFGFILWIPDLTKTLCAPMALFNGRALFHYSVAVTLYFLAIFYSKNE